MCSLLPPRDGSEVEYVGVSVKMNRILEVTLSHPCIGERDANNFHKMRRLIREPFEALKVLCPDWA